MAQQVSQFVVEYNTTTNAQIKAWLDALTINSVIGTWTLPLSNTRALLILAYKDA